MPGIVTGAPRLLLRLEALAVLVAASATYAWIGDSWWLFAALLLVPDVSMLAYLGGPRRGAAIYNLSHWYVVPLAFFAWGLYEQAKLPSDIGLAWAAHIGLDRALGYGLKYVNGFKVSHLGLIDHVFGK